MRFQILDKNLLALYTTGVTTSQGRKIAKRYPKAIIESFFKIMDRIAAASDISDLSRHPGYRFHGLQGEREGQYALRLNDQFRLVIVPVTDEHGNLLHIIEIVDYH